MREHNFGLNGYVDKSPTAAMGSVVGPASTARNCNLKTADGQLKVGDGLGALATSIGNVEACKELPKPNAKALAHAYHNVGINHFRVGRYPAALGHLAMAERTKHADIHLEAMAAVRLASAQATAMQKIEERMTLETNQAALQQAAGARAEEASKLTNEQIEQMAKAGLPAAVILSKIKTSGCAFNTGTDALISLNKSSVPDNSSSR